MDGAFGKAGCVGDRAHTGADGMPFGSCCLPVEMKIDQVSGRFFVVADQIPHQYIQNVIVYGNGSFETRHRQRIKEAVRRRK